MVGSQRGAAAEESCFRVGDWLVQPALNRICLGGRTVVLEPRLVDVLVFLVERAGQVVSKDELIDGVWKTEFITEWAITRAIAKLRKALGDDAAQPRFIETISKRGYRLIATVQTTPARSEPRRAEVAPPARARGSVPYVVGQWVRGAQFYGRQAPLAEILDGHRECLWVLGTRVSGKTSLLRQIEFLAATEPARGFEPVYWDLQGAEKPADLDEGFSEALLDCRSRLDAAGVEVGSLAGGELFASLGALRRALGAQGRALLLLCDEAEELLGLGRRAPALLRKLRCALQGREGIRTVLAASPRLWALAEQTEDTSPFLHGFTPPVYLGPLSDDEARALVQQDQLDAAARPCLDEGTTAKIVELCGRHPYLLSLLASRVLACGELETAVTEVEADPSVGHLFAVDLSLLADAEAEFLLALGRAEQSPPLDGAQPGTTFQLERLGLVRRVGDRHVVGNHFLKRWLDRRCS